MSSKLKSPNITNLLYEKVHDFSEKEIGSYNFEAKVLENKILYIIEALSLLIYGMPIFHAKFYAREKGPVESTMEKIQNKSDNLKNLDKNDYENFDFPEFVANELFRLTIEGMKKELIPKDPNLLSQITHTEGWREKHKNYIDYKNNKDDKIYDNTFSLEDIYNFAENILEKEYPDFVEYVKDGI